MIATSMDMAPGVRHGNLVFSFHRNETNCVHLALDDFNFTFFQIVNNCIFSDSTEKAPELVVYGWPYGNTAVG